MPHLTVLGAMVLFESFLRLNEVCDNARSEFCVADCRNVLGSIIDQVGLAVSRASHVMHRMGGAGAEKFSATGAALDCCRRGQNSFNRLLLGRLTRML